MLVERVCRSWRRRRKVRRWRKHKPGRWERLLGRFRRWRRRWRHVWRQWQALLDGALQGRASASDIPTTCTAETSTVTVSEEAGEQPPAAQATAVEVVDEVKPMPRRGPGRPCTIPTGHKCCPRQDCEAYGRFGDDPLHDIVGNGTYPTKLGEKRQMYKCNVRGQPFSETAGTIFFGLKTLCFSKKREYLEYHLHLALAYYHFARHHASLRVKLPEPIPTRGTGSPKKWQQRTPAMAAGLTDHQWSLRELLMCPVPTAPT